VRDFAIVVPWHRAEQRDAFLQAWGVSQIPDWLILQQDENKEGCGVTKNKGIARANADIVVVLDDDCFPDRDAWFSDDSMPQTLMQLAEKHARALEPQEVLMFEKVTNPPSRGTPYHDLSICMPVAASMGFWSQIGDYCAVRQLAYDAAEMSYSRRPVYGRYFALCGMNIAFRPALWSPWCTFIDVLRFDDIWMGWLWQKEAYRRGCCFNLAGPMVRHSRQSNVWRNLIDEAAHLERSETLWRDIATAKTDDYVELRQLLPV